jgi:hypothetical protein
MALPSDTLPGPAAVCVPRGEPLGVNFAARPKTGERDILDRSNGREGYIVVVISVQKDSDGCGSLTDGVVAKVSRLGANAATYTGEILPPQQVVEVVSLKIVG